MEAQGYTITGLKAVRENLVSQRSPVEAHDVAGVPAEHIFTTQGSLLRGSTFLQSQGSWAVREHIFTTTGLMGCGGAHLYNTGLMGCGGAHLYNTGLIGCKGAHSYNRRAYWL
jgi:hypothetical protein